MKKIFLLTLVLLITPNLFAYKKQPLKDFSVYSDLMNKNPFLENKQNEKEIPVIIEKKEEKVEEIAADPFEYIVVTGIASVGNKYKTFIENTRTKESFYLSKGDVQAGMEVLDINQGAVTLKMGGSIKQLHRVE